MVMSDVDEKVFFGSIFVLKFSDKKRPKDLLQVIDEFFQFFLIGNIFFDRENNQIFLQDPCSQA